MALQQITVTATLVYDDELNRPVSPEQLKVLLDPDNGEEDGFHLAKINITEPQPYLGQDRTTRSRPR